MLPFSLIFIEDYSLQIEMVPLPLKQMAVNYKIFHCTEGAAKRKEKPKMFSFSCEYVQHNN